MPAKIAHIIAHPNLNGGTTSVCQIIRGLKKYYDIDGDLLVVNKRGDDETTNKNLIETSGLNVAGYHRYKDFKKKIARKYDVVIQHRLFGAPCLEDIDPFYIVVNHTVQGPGELRRFQEADVFVSVSAFLDGIARYPRKKKHVIIVNGMEYWEPPESGLKPGCPVLEQDKFRTGRCHRLCGGKFSDKATEYLNGIKGHVHYMIGKPYHNEMDNVRYLGVIDDQDWKMSLLSSLHLYFYDNMISEGSSMAVLETLSLGVPILCRDKGGTNELVQNGVNGIYFKTYEDVQKQIRRLIRKRPVLRRLRKSTKAHFDKFLHIRHCVAKYAKLLAEHGFS